MIVAEGLDRLSRDQEDTAALYKQLSFAGVKLFTQLAQAIVRRLNAAKIPGPFGKAWNGTTIRCHHDRRTGILRNDLYAGWLIWNKQHYVKEPGTGKRLARPNPRPAWTVQQVPELRIVADELGSRVRARLGGHPRQPDGPSDTGDRVLEAPPRAVRADRQGVLWNLRRPCCRDPTRLPRLQRELDSATTAAPLLHPNLAKIYRDRVARLHEAFTDDTTRTEATGLLRGLIDRVLLHPGERSPVFELVGDIASTELLEELGRHQPLP